MVAVFFLLSALLASYIFAIVFSTKVQYYFIIYIPSSPLPQKDKNIDRLFEKTKDPQNDSSVCALPIHRALYITATEANNRQWSSREISSRIHGLGIWIIWLVSALLYPKLAG